MCVISAYVPMETASEVAKDRFYDDLTNLILSIPLHTVLVIAGDLNARIIKGSHECHSRIIVSQSLQKTVNNSLVRSNLSTSISLTPHTSTTEHLVSAPTETQTETTSNSIT